MRSGALQPEDLLCLTLVGEASGTCDVPVHPDGTWVDPEFTPYVPFRYAICLSHGSTMRNFVSDQSRIVEMLPPAARELLSEKEQISNCFDITTEEARALNQILTDAGYFWLGEGFVRATYERTSLLMSPPPVFDPAVWVSFEPVLPNGAIS